MPSISELSIRKKVKPEKVLEISKSPLIILLLQLYNYSFTNQTLLSNAIQLSPEQVITTFGLHYTQFIGFIILTGSFTLNGGTFEDIMIQEDENLVELITKIKKSVAQQSEADNDWINPQTLFQLGLTAASDTKTTPMDQRLVLMFKAISSELVIKIKQQIQKNLLSNMNISKKSDAESFREFEQFFCGLLDETMNVNQTAHKFLNI